MTIIVREDVEVTDTETEIIESQETDKEKDRYFGVANGDEEIEVIAWGSNDNENWEEKATITISANEADSFIVGPHVCWVKLTGKTTRAETTSIVDACLFYGTPPS